MAESFFDTYRKWFKNKDGYTAQVVLNLFTHNIDLCISNADKKIVSFPGNYSNCSYCGYQLNFACECVNKNCVNYYEDGEGNKK